VADQNQTESRKKRKKITFIVFAIVVVVGALAIIFYLQYKKTHISTDDAYVDGRIHTIAAKVSGTVRYLYVTDNEKVKSGEPLLELDPADYKVKADASRAALENEQAC
jgi:membrane fusion protein, multidrug efflux system